MSIVNSYKTLDSFVKLENAFKKDLEKVEKYIDYVVKDQPVWFQEVINHLVKAGGKRVRPLLVCLSYSLVSDNPIDSKVISLAGMAEYVHTATLFHDDVIDDGHERRGKPTANKVYGNHTAVLGGDFILGKVFSELNSLGNHEFLTTMIDTITKLIDGEIHQMDMQAKNRITLEDYEKLIYLKTASLFEWSMVAGGLAANKSPEIILTLRKMGFHIGRIFQIIDDILDYTGSNILGKKRLQDFHQGKITLPLLFLFKKDESYFYEWKSMIDGTNTKSLDKISDEFVKRIKKDDLQKEMLSYLDEDIKGIRTILDEKLPSSPYHKYMNNLIDFLVSRIY
jgi:octaprenyl-diphosphate synthase